ncbi:ComF family protein [Actinomarinicola tropica]|uniref:ComF family protein n=1 Tax=Actinomarinicola tropica TaxID=2789776 RepID=A0A5Q2RJ22_9ACTN|nr:phosphoribosyltransferase family protein [Actinomarinicola tropica]QGG95793.1 ComF family protein [Actinomarinicola tropica]
MLLATLCPICRRPDGAPCPECVELLEPSPPVPCPDGLVAVHAALRYEGAARLLVAGVKYRDARAAVGWLADAMVAALPADGDIEVVTWAPTTRGRRRRRGFDHSELLARAVARRIRRPSMLLLRRRDGPAQTGRAAAERQQGVEFCGDRRAAGRAVLLVDDVVTTGATLGAAGRALGEAGARQVTGLVAGATPPPSGPPSS